MDDPFKHDVIFMDDRAGEYPRIDLIIAKYKWELEGLEEAKPLEDILFPVLSKPYLVTMKLKAGSLKDDSDIVGLYELMTAQEKKKAFKLARLIHRDKKLKSLLAYEKPRQEKENKSLLIRQEYSEE